MPVARRGIALAAVLAAVVTLGLLSALVLVDAVLESRVAAMAGDRAVARAALLEGLDALDAPPDLAGLCAAAILAPQSRAGTATGGGRYRVRWTHLGSGAVRGEVRGEGRQGAVTRAVGQLRPDSTTRLSGFFRCPSATRLIPAGPDWLQVHPEG